MKVSQSEIKLWRHCRFSWAIRHKELLEPRSPGRPRVFGKLTHEILEAHIDGKPWLPVVEKAAKTYAKLFRTEIEEYGDIPREVTELMQLYFGYYRKDGLTYLAVDGKKSEHYFEVGLTPDITLTGMIDMYLQDKEKRRWLGDHKTGKQEVAQEVRFWDVQSMIYLWAWSELGRPSVEGFMWNYVKSRGPSSPELLKNGEMSRSAKVRTTWIGYKNALIEHGLKPSDYLEMKEKLEHKELDFFNRVWLPYSTPVMKAVVRDAKVTAREIRDMGRGTDKTQPRNMGRHCSWCSEYHLCQADLRGYDTKDVRLQHYKRKTKDHYGKKISA